MRTISSIHVMAGRDLRWHHSSLDNANRDRPGRLDKIVKTMLDCDQVLMDLWQVHAAAGGAPLHQAGLHSPAGRPAPRHQAQEEAS